MSVIIKGLSSLSAKIKRDIKSLDNKLSNIADAQEQADHVHGLRRSLALTEYSEAVERAARRHTAAVAEADSDYTNRTAALSAKEAKAAHSHRRLGRINRHLSRALDEHEEDVQLHS